MSFAELEQLIRRLLSTGVAVVIVLIAPGTGTLRTPDEPPVVTVEPDRARGVPDTGDGSILVEPGTDSPGTADGGTGSIRGGGADTPPSTGGRPGSAGTGSAGTGSAAGSGTTAAARFGWGTPNRVDDFEGGAEQWNVYDGPGHAGNGTRSPSAVSISNSVLTITGDSAGTTAGLAWNPGQMYGRWEARVRAPASDPSYHALLLLWPDAGNFPVGGEIDFMEMMEPTRRVTDIFVHYGADNSQVNGKVRIDGTQWRNWAVEWTPEAITAYVDGEQWYRTTDATIFPPGPMHLCIQLDWFPRGGRPRESQLHVDWVRQYSPDGGWATGPGDLTGLGARPSGRAPSRLPN